MVRHALAEMVDWPSRLIAFSDDMDGMRKVPPGVPHQDMMHAASRPAAVAGCPTRSAAATRAMPITITACCASSSTGSASTMSSSPRATATRSGRFDETLKAVLRNYDAIMDVMLPTLRRGAAQDLFAGAADQPEERQGAAGADRGASTPRPGMVAFEDEGERVEQSILSGGAKLQWKVDWAMRWVALGVDYEMSGKDLIDSVTQSSKIARILGAPAARGLQLRDVPRREWREDLQDQGQWRHHRRMADLCARGEPRFLHLPRAEEGQAAELLGHPQGGRRI